MYRLPVPSIISEKSVNDSYADEPEKHKGRLRSFPHERGNWSTYVYIPCMYASLSLLVNCNCCNYMFFCYLVTPSKKLFCFINILLRECSKITEFDIIEDFHLSLSRTVVLKYHWITSFFSSLKNIASNSYRYQSCSLLV